MLRRRKLAGGGLPLDERYVGVAPGLSEAVARAVLEPAAAALEEALRAVAGAAWCRFVRLAVWVDADGTTAVLEVAFAYDHPEHGPCLLAARREPEPWACPAVDALLAACGRALLDPDAREDALAAAARLPASFWARRGDMAGLAGRRKERA